MLIRIVILVHGLSHNSILFLVDCKFYEHRREANNPYTLFCGGER